MLLLQRGYWPGIHLAARLPEVPGPLLSLAQTHRHHFCASATNENGPESRERGAVCRKNSSLIAISHDCNRIALVIEIRLSIETELQ